LSTDLTRTLDAQESRAALEADAPGLSLVRVYPGELAVFDLPIDGREKLTIGRSDEHADVLIEGDQISRLHLALSKNYQGAVEVTDLGSKNGSWLEGARLVPNTPVSLSDGMLLRLGDTLFVLRKTSAKNIDLSARSHAHIPGCSPGAVAARRELTAAVKDTGPLLILGETGTGKEFAAKMLLGSEGAPWIAVNCGELSPQLARGELFGTERGTYTDAQTRPGLIADADGGVLLLDEIGDLELGVQVELLRFLEDGTYRRVGGRELLKSTARVIAATNIDLDAAVADGRFRRDLLGRLRSASRPIILSPLRERREDLLEWARRFLEHEGERSRAFSTGFAERLLLHDWRENLRELSGVLRSACRKAARGTLHSEHLAGILHMRAHAPSSEDAVKVELNGDTPVGTNQALASPVIDRDGADPTRAEIEAVLALTVGNVRETSERLGIERTRLYRLFKSYGIDAEHYRQK
jgi:DNA-binding NtrC family response regulator